MESYVAAIPPENISPPMSIKRRGKIFPLRESFSCWQTVPKEIVSHIIY
jgi:hypothetical protein